MRIAFITALPYGSVANNMYRIQDAAAKNGHTCFTFSKPIKDFVNKKENHEFIGNCFSVRMHNLLAGVTGFEGIYSFFPTLGLIRRLKEIKPDIIMLLNLHGWYLNLPLLFSYIKKNNIKVVWRFPDSWPMTGHCTGYATVKCDKWKTGCHHCPQYKFYPQTKVDRSKSMYRLKKKWFTGIKDLTVVSITKYMAKEIKQSYLKDYDLRVIYNGVNLDVFKPTESDFREKYNLQDKYIVLGVASDWSERKGIDVMVELGNRLDEKYKVVVVGIKEIKGEHNILALPALPAEELRKIYTAASVFANPTREEAFGNVNIEALACGTPIVMFNTDGAPESIDETCGKVVEREDVSAMQEWIEKTCTQNIFPEENCLKRAEFFRMEDRYMDYVKLFEEKWS